MEKTAHEDHIFADPKPKIKDFEFGAETAKVFDDMLDRSVPFYEEVQRMIVELSQSFAAENTQVFDLGCSTGTTLFALAKTLPDTVPLVGIDSSIDMLGRAEQKLAAFKNRVRLVCANLEGDLGIENASVVIMNLTLQFVRPLNRETLIRQIARGLRPNGCLIVVEKVLSNDSNFNRLFIDYYYRFKKRQGYSELEISQKREALENVLIPYRVSENIELFLKNGFQRCEIFFQWYNFCGFIARV